jgi:hypothetical protein
MSFFSKDKRRFSMKKNRNNIGIMGQLTFPVMVEYLHEVR